MEVENREIRFGMREEERRLIGRQVLSLAGEFVAAMAHLSGGSGNFKTTRLKDPRQALASTQLLHVQSVLFVIEY